MPDVSWPVWDYVARSMYRRNPPVTEIEELLLSMPVLPRTSGQPPYGLIWRTQAFYGTLPSPDEQVGLTVAGLHRLRVRDVSAGALADLVVRVFSEIAARNQELVPNPSIALAFKAPIDEIVLVVEGTAQITVPQITASDLHKILQKEYVPLQVYQSDDGPFVQQQISLSLYFGFNTAENYISRITREAPLTRGRPRISPLELMRAIDYLSLVLERDVHWKTGPLVAVPNYQAVADIVLPVEDRADFSHGLLELVTIFTQFKTPEISVDRLAKFGDSQPNSISRLGDWLELRMDGTDALDTIRESITDIRAVIDLRRQFAHTGEEKVETRAAKARDRLGLPQLIFDWQSAWDVVRSRSAEAFDSIARVIRDSQVN